MGTLSAYTSFLLVACSRRSGRDTYESVARHCFGPKMELVVDSAICLIAFMGVVGYYVLLGQLVEPVVSQYIVQSWKSDSESSAAAAGHRLVVRALLVVLMLPVTLWKDMHALRFTSFVSIITMTFLCAVIILRSVVSFERGGVCGGTQWVETDKDANDITLFFFFFSFFRSLFLFFSLFLFLSFSLSLCLSVSLSLSFSLFLSFSLISLSSRSSPDSKRWGAWPRHLATWSCTSAATSSSFASTQRAFSRSRSSRPPSCVTSTCSRFTSS